MSSTVAFKQINNSKKMQEKWEDRITVTRQLDGEVTRQVTDGEKVATEAGPDITCAAPDKWWCVWTKESLNGVARRSHGCGHRAGNRYFLSATATSRASVPRGQDVSTSRPSARFHTRAPNSFLNYSLGRAWGIRTTRESRDSSQYVNVGRACVHICVRDLCVGNMRLWYILHTLLFCYNKFW